MIKEMVEEIVEIEDYVQTKNKIGNTLYLPIKKFGVKLKTLENDEIDVDFDGFIFTVPETYENKLVCVKYHTERTHYKIKNK